MFLNLVITFPDTGYSEEQRGGHGGRPPSEMIQEEILENVENDPTTGARSIVIKHTDSKVLKTLQPEQFYPYHPQRLQALQPKNYLRRVEFCQWLLHEHKIKERNLIEAQIR